MSHELVDAILQFVTSEEGGVPSSLIAEKYLKLQNAGPLGLTMVQKVLAGEPRLQQDEQGLWVTQEFEGALLKDTPFFVIRCEVSSDRQKIGDVSIWQVKSSDWKHVETISLLENPQEKLATIAPYLENERCLFFSHYEQRLLMKYLTPVGILLSDDTWPVSALFKMLNQQMTGKREGLLSVAEQLIPITQEPTSCKDEGALLAELVASLLEKAVLSGYPTQILFDTQIAEKILQAPWSKATFTLADTESYGGTPGVYGFRDANDTMLYVGKAKSLNKRLQSYFRLSDESPQKIEQLRKEAVTLMMHPCGSEIEALITEHRLIGKYNPPLNTHRSYHHDTEEWKGFASTIFVLPSVDSQKIMTLWVPQTSNILMQAFRRNSLPDTLESDLSLFFSTAEYEAPSEEKVIALRWLRAHLDAVTQIMVDECVDMADVVDRIKEACLEEDLNGKLMR